MWILTIFIQFHNLWHMLPLNFANALKPEKIFRKSWSFSNDSQLRLDYMSWTLSPTSFFWLFFFFFNMISAGWKPTLQLTHCDYSLSTRRTAPPGVKWLSYHGNTRGCPIRSLHGNEILCFPGGLALELWPPTLLLMRANDYPMSPHQPSVGL